MNKQVMISQPMNGKTEEEIREERQELINKLKDKGYTVVDTIISNSAPDNEDAAIYYLAKSIEYIGQVDEVIFMRGWECARGCRIEHAVAVAYGKEVDYESNLD